MGNVMTYLRYVCAKDPDGPSDEHDTDILIVRCALCLQFAVAGYVCACGHKDADPPANLGGHGPGECIGT
jgi:hypothetical protein